MAIKVCDRLCGAGKTQAAIRMMNENPDKKFLFITPFLEEAQRIKYSCPLLNFAEPAAYDSSGKFGSLISLLENGRNVASTHALFRRYDKHVAELIRQQGYTLILDEVFDVFELLGAHPHDVQDAIAQGHISVDSAGRVHWNNDGYDGEFTRYRKHIKNGYVTVDKDKLILWLFPIEVFEAFRDVYILTYMFDAQIQKYYFDLNGCGYEIIGTRHLSGIDYEFCAVEDADPPPSLSGKIHILDDLKSNEVGKKKTALSVSWHKKPDTDNIERLRRSLYNVLHNKFGVPSKDILWTTYKGFRNALQGKGFKKSFLSFNARARNDFADRHYLAYCVNLYMNPTMRNYFVAQGIKIDQDKYALSEMIQWVWRSAIRRGEEIWLYVPSSRMRGLFYDWLEEMK